MKNILMVLVFTVLLSCSGKPSLQKYFVDNSESSDFIVLDLGKGFVNTDKLTLSATEKEALKSFKKLNVLIFKNEANNKAKFKEEDSKIASILNDEQYQELIKFNNSGQNISVYFLGEENYIDEFVVFTSSQEKGLAVVRVLGDNMNPKNIFVLLDVMKKTDLDVAQLKPLQEIIN